MQQPSEKILEPPKDNADRSWIPKGYVLPDRPDDYWVNVVFNAGIAQLLFPFLLCAFQVSLPFSRGINGIEQLLVTTLILFAFGTVMQFAMCIVAAFVAIVLSCVLKFFSSNYRNLSVGGLTGGIAGLLLVAWVGIVGRAIDRSFISALIVATTLGNIGGTWGAWLTPSVKNRTIARQDEPVNFRFSTRQLLLVTAWFAVVLALLKLAGILTPVFLVIFGIWLVTQLAMLGLIWLVLRRYLRKLPAWDHYEI